MKNNLFEKTIKMLYATTFDKHYENLLDQMAVLTFLLENNITTKRHYYKMILEDHIEDVMGKYDYNYKDAKDAVNESHNDIQSIVDYEWQAVYDMLGNNFNKTDIQNKLNEVLNEIDSY